MSRRRIDFADDGTPLSRALAALAECQRRGAAGDHAAAVRAALDAESAAVEVTAAALAALSESAGSARRAAEAAGLPPRTVAYRLRADRARRAD